MLKLCRYCIATTDAQLIILCIFYRYSWLTHTYSPPKENRRSSVLFAVSSRSDLDRASSANRSWLHLCNCDLPLGFIYKCICMKILFIIKQKKLRLIKHTRISLSIRFHLTIYQQRYTVPTYGRREDSICGRASSHTPLLDLTHWLNRLGSSLPELPT